MYLNYVKNYIREAQKIRNRIPQCFNIYQLLKYYPAWQASLNGKTNPLIDEKPWITFAAFDFLKQILTKEMRVFEYGSGGSTVYYAKRVKEVISVEHDQLWNDKVTNYIKLKKYSNVKSYLIQPNLNTTVLNRNPSDPDSYISDSNIYSAYSFEKYVRHIDNYPDKYFDLISIDGRARPSCIKHSINKVKIGGYILLDNAEREYYHYIHDVMKRMNYICYNYYGPGPYGLNFWQTCIWKIAKI